MPHRRHALASADRPAARVVPFAVALRRTFAAGYDAAALRADLLAGLVVGIIALPLSMALAIAVGVPPQHGLYTAIVAGVVAAVTGGSKFQVTGPTAAFVVVLAPIAARHGVGGLLTAGLGSRYRTCPRASSRRSPRSGRRAAPRPWRRSRSRARPSRC